MTEIPREAKQTDSAVGRERPQGHGRTLALAIAILAAFTWRAPLMFFSGDDMMNMYKAWRTPARDLIHSLWAFWTPAYRPLGGAMYRGFYAAFGFHPAPLYALCWLVLLANLALLYMAVAKATGTRFHPLVACVIATVHGMYLDLYYSAGTMYDRLAALFCLIALNVWLRVRMRGETPGVGLTVAIALLTIAACDGKENAVALPVILLAAELLLVRRTGARQRIRALMPVALSAAIVAIFIVSRITNTADMSTNAAYQPHISGATFLADLSVYLGYVSYGAISGTGVAAGGLVAMAALTAFTRSRTMAFGFIWFIAALLPVSFIAARLGYALYLPMMGFGIWVADALYRALLLLRAPARAMPACAVGIAMALCCWNAIEWPRNWDVRQSPEWITTRQFRARYPKLARGSKLLFVTDPFPRYAYDLLFNLRLMYGDDTITADRILSGPPDQRPRRGAVASDYDHVFEFERGDFESAAYVEYAPEWNAPGEIEWPR